MKKNIVIIILTILVLGLGGYLVYDKVIDKEEFSTNEKTQSSESDKVVENNNSTEIKGNKFLLKKGEFTQVLEGDEDFVVIVDNGQAYLAYDGDDMTNNIKTITSKFTSYKINNYIEDLANPDAGVNCYKLDQLNNVVAAYDLYQGHNGVYFTFILDNGKVALIDEGELLREGKINVQILEGLENIVTFVQAKTVGAFNAYAIDINGNQIDLANYLK